MNSVFGQGNLQFCSNSGKSQGNLYHFGYFKVFLTFIERLNKKKPDKYVKHFTFSIQIVMFKVSKICPRSGKSKGIFSF